MFSPTFETLSEVQDRFYADRPLMWAANQNVLSLLERVEGEAQECREAIVGCMTLAGAGKSVDLCAQEIRDEISDLLLFVMALAKCCGLTSFELVADGMEKMAKSQCRYQAHDYQDMSANFQDAQEKSRGEDKRRGFTTQFYQIAA
jgi:NTP pyrophosphatase (non-canonical NTP hydrolase)